MRKKDFSESMQVLERRKREAGAESTADLYRAVRNWFGRYCMKERLSLQDVGRCQPRDLQKGFGPS